MLVRIILLILLFDCVLIALHEVLKLVMLLDLIQNLLSCVSDIKGGILALVQ